jgi:hypothetical protein
MADGFTVDDSEVRALAVDIGDVPQIAGPFMRSAVEVTSRHIKDDWRSGTGGIKGASAFPYSISYDIYTAAAGASVIAGKSVIVSEIGPDKGKPQGPLGNLIEFEGDKSGGLSSREGFGEASLERNADDFEKGLSIATRDAERAAGL